MIGVINYGLGNFHAFLNIYKRLNLPCKLISCVSDFDQVDRFILPGVGAFDHAMLALETSGLMNRLSIRVLQDKIPVLGICVGMQMMAHTSEEGSSEGLGWITGHVKKLKVKSSIHYPLPHMGWNTVSQLIPSQLFSEIPDQSEFYFLHSYYFEATNDDDIIAQAAYPDNFSAVVRKNNIYGIQCHPEKSHSHGIQLLKNFAEISAVC